MAKLVKYQKTAQQDTYYLRGTVFTSAIGRATSYDDIEKAREALTAAAKFHPAGVVRKCEIIDAPAVISEGAK